MKFTQLINQSPYILTEGAVVERIKRKPGIVMDTPIVNAALIYDTRARSVMAEIYSQYIAVSMNAGIPMAILTPTWRCNKYNIEASGYGKVDVNKDCFAFVEELRNSCGSHKGKILIGGLMGTKGDSYNPREALSLEEAFTFHSYQTERLSKSGVDFMIASTLPALSEAAGLAKAMGMTGEEYVISFVLRPDGTLLDGNMLWRAIEVIDSMDFQKPAFYMANCIHPSILGQALENQGERVTGVLERFWGLQGNTSAKSPEELNESAELFSQDADEFAEDMVELYRKYGLKVLGGCCGTDQSHMESLAGKLKG